MLRLRVWGPTVLIALFGCHHDGEEARSPREARRFAVNDCLANIEVYPPGQAPAQPYRVVSPLDASFVGNWGWSSASRFKRMKKRACELGADAILDADDSGPDARVTTTYQYDAYGRPVAVVQDASNAKRSTALAIQFVGQQPEAPPVVVAPPMAGSMVVPTAGPQVVVNSPQVVVAAPQVLVAPQAAR